MNNLELLQAAEVLVTKIGGDNAGRLRENYDHVVARLADGQKTVLVTSAIRSSDEQYSNMAHPAVVELDGAGNPKTGFNTTSHLKQVGAFLKKKKIREALKVFAAIRQFTNQVVVQEINEDDQLSETDRDLIFHKMDEVMNALTREIDNLEFGDDILELKEDLLIQKADGRLISLTGFGESLAKTIYEAYFQAKSLKYQGVDTDKAYAEVFGENDPAQILANDGDKSEAEERLRATISRKISEVIDENDCLVLGGYAPLVASQRGYSDKMGALVAVEVKQLGKKVAYLIEKQFPIMSIDPRIIGEARAKVINQMVWDFAKEAFGTQFGADGGAIQEDTIDILQDGGVEIFVANPNDLDPDKITRVFDYEPEPNGIEMVGVRRAKSVIQIKSTRMNNVGITEDIGHWFSENKFSYDHSATSETTMTFTFSNQKFSPENLKNLEDYLGDRFVLRHEEDISMIFCMGNNMSQTGPFHRMATALKKENISTRLSTQGINERVMIIGIDHADVPAAMDQIHFVGVELPDESYERIFAETANSIDEERARLLVDS